MRFGLLLCLVFLLSGCGTASSAGNASVKTSSCGCSGRAAEGAEASSSDDYPSEIRTKIRIAEGVVLPASGVSIELAAEYVERALITGYEGPRTNEPWVIVFDRPESIEGVAAYGFSVGQAESSASDDWQYTEAFRAGVSVDGKIYIVEDEGYRLFGEISPDELQ